MNDNRTTFGRTKYTPVVNNEGKVIYGVSKKSVCDLTGKKIAFFSCQEDNKKDKIRVYDSDFGKFRLVGISLYLDGNFVGHVIKKPNISAIVISTVIALLAVLTVGLINTINWYEEELPTITLKDKNGEIDVEKEIAVFDNEIKPGSKGEYQFVIKNPNKQDMIYSFVMSEFYNKEEIDNFPIKYRILMSNIYIINEDKWVTSNELSFNELIISESSSVVFTIEWWWPYDGYSDSLDTLYGNDNGKYSIVLELAAEFVEGDN